MWNNSPLFTFVKLVLPTLTTNRGLCKYFVTLFWASKRVWPHITHAYVILVTTLLSLNKATVRFKLPSEFIYTTPVQNYSAKEAVKG